MKCPICRKKMEEYAEPQAQFEPEHIKEQLFPVKIKCLVYHIFTCDKCNVKVSKSESKDYING